MHAVQFFAEHAATLIIPYLAVRACGAFEIKADKQVFCAVFPCEAAVQHPLTSVRLLFKYPSWTSCWQPTTHWTLISSFFKIVCEGQLCQIPISSCNSWVGLPPLVFLVALVNFEYPHTHRFFFLLIQSERAVKHGKLLLSNYNRSRFSVDVSTFWILDFEIKSDCSLIDWLIY